MNTSHYNHLQEITEDQLNEVPTLDAALHQDPVGCARKLVCSLAVRPRSSLKQEELAVLAVVRSVITDICLQIINVLQLYLSMYQTAQLQNRFVHY